MSDPALTPLIPQIEALARQTLATHRLPGLALGIVRDQQLAWWGGFGAANLESGAAPDQHSLARVASVTKTFTTTAILQLRDQGLLGLDDPLVDHLSEFAQVQPLAGPVEGVTLRRLLTHRSGLVTEAPVLGWGAERFPSRDEILGALPQTQIVIPQDSSWKYSNLGFGLLGEVIARLSGQPYTAYIHEHILAPLGLESTVFDLTDDLRHRCLTGYDHDPYQDRPAPARYAHLDGIAAAGQLHSSVDDLSRWIAFQFCTDGGPRQGAQILAGTTLAEIQRPQYMESDWSAGQCLGWRANRIGDRVYHSHGGGIYGFGTQVVFNTPSRTGAVLFINIWPPPGGTDLAEKVLELILDAEPTPTPQIDLSPTPDAWRPLLGHYVAAPGIHVDIVHRDGRLRMVPHGGRASSLHAPGVLQATDQSDRWQVVGGRAAGETAVFTLADNGQVLSYELGAFVFVKQGPTA
ncbi:MAG: serine hydrolase [Candidatus Latescibacteria bacterium]|nr:serine hydrolase [Candidatus Latescibacterota bacterium]